MRKLMLSVLLSATAFAGQAYGQNSLTEDELVNAVAVAAVFQNKCQDIIGPGSKGDAWLIKFVDDMSPMVNNQKLVLASVNQFRSWQKLGPVTYCGVTFKMITSREVPGLE
jgi:hypothetical protein